MRRDLCYVYPTDVRSLYLAYLTAAKNPPFGRSCREEPYHTITFGLNFSMKYNMNGGSCTLHFIPTEGGSAIDFRFSIAQGAGARYGRYAEDLARQAALTLGMMGTVANIPIEQFIDPCNQVDAYGTVAAPVSAGVPAAPAPAPTPAPVPAPTPVAASAPAPAPAQAAPVGQARFCTACGSPLPEGGRFCSQCGVMVAPPQRFCTGCGAKVGMEDIFCFQCGTKL